MLEKENGSWWRTRRWWILGALWPVVLNGSLMMMILGGMEANAAFALFLGLAAAFLPVAAIILGQDSLLREKHSGTAAWVLTKPLGRSAFILAKMIANGLGLVATGIVLPGAIAWVQLAVVAGAPTSVPSLAAAMGLVCLNMLFYLALALMLATLFNTRGPGLGITLGMLLGYQLLGLIPAVKYVLWLGEVLPWGLVSGFGKNAPLVAYLITGQPLPTVMPIIATAAWCVLFVLAGIWRFGREEF
jgi:ABC-type transport system involved in multi-copper enzyme maturation permease subunit